MNCTADEYVVARHKKGCSVTTVSSTFGLNVLFIWLSTVIPIWIATLGDYSDKTTWGAEPELFTVGRPEWHQSPILNLKNRVECYEPVGRVHFISWNPDCGWYDKQRLLGRVDCALRRQSNCDQRSWQKANISPFGKYWFPYSVCSSGSKIKSTLE